MAPSRNSSEFLIVFKILCFRLSNKSLNTPFPKKIKTPSTTLRFIRFVAKISVLNPKLPADGQCNSSIYIIRGCG
ncbi:hypothetical protein HanOQP8_Chr00c599g0843161 [Helianthus annuus]|nr:hypothetical protein HanHA89_CPg0757391 [Helianthus annuus]KAJ0799580.1 hypothetical protein HanOQP8_Chr00c599g0843161 [Helianthus annuus]